MSVVDPSPSPVVRGKIDLSALGLDASEPANTSESVLARRRRTNVALWVGYAVVAVAATIALLLAGSPAQSVRVQVLATPSASSR